MSSDMFIRVVREPVTRRMVRDYLWTPLDNEYCLSSRPGVQRRFAKVLTPERFRRGALAAPFIPHLPSLLIGRLSWARAIYSVDPTRYVATHLRRAQDILTTVPLLTPNLVDQLTAMMGVPDESIYTGTYNASQGSIRSFLELFEGAHVFTDTVPTPHHEQGGDCDHGTTDAA